MKPLVAVYVMIALALAGCATDGVAPPRPEPVIVVKEVKVPVPVPCNPELGPEPDYPDTDAALRAAPNLFERTKLLAAGRLLRIARDTEKTAAWAKCAFIPAD